MKLAIMQPYLFPYLGYFSLLGSVDRFVFYDDVDFIKSGWINRNRLYLSGDVRYFTIPLLGASSNLKINEIKVQPVKVWQRKIVQSIRQSYSKAPYFKQTIDLVEDVFSVGCDNISEYATHSVMKTTERLGLNVDFVKSSSVYNNQELSGVARVVDICLKERACEYLNLPGGQELYKESDFSRNGIKLGFVEAEIKSYPQFDRAFAPGLSIIDVLMFNCVAEARDLIGVKHDSTKQGK